MRRFILIFFILLLLKLQLTAELYNDLVDIVNVQTNSCQIKFSDKIKTDTNYLLILRLNSKTPVSPDLTKKYSVKDSLQSLNSTGDGNNIIYIDSKNYISEFENLMSGNLYNVDIYYKNKDNYTLKNTLTFSTLAELPVKQTKRVMWTEQNYHSLNIIAAGGSGKSVLVAISSSPNDFVPVSGSSYKADSCYGKGSEPLPGVFVVSSDSNKTVNISCLESGTFYFISCFEYNGQGESSNYLSSIEKLGNAIKLSTLIETPKLLSIQKVAEDKLNVVWKEVTGASSYIVELAYDPNFEQFEETYGSIDLGILSDYLFEGLKPKKKYYVRVRATNGKMDSDYSEVFSIDL